MPAENPGAQAIGEIRVIPGNPDASKVMRTLEGRGKQMPPRKHALQPTKEEVRRVRDWIAAGAPDDSRKEDVRKQP